MKLIGVLVVLVGAIQLSEAEPANQCDPYCPYDYKPICAGPKEEDTHQPRIFSNECDLKQFNCKNDYSELTINCLRSQ